MDNERRNILALISPKMMNRTFTAERLRDLKRGFPSAVFVSTKQFEDPDAGIRVVGSDAGLGFVDSYAHSGYVIISPPNERVVLNSTKETLKDANDLHVAQLHSLGDQSALLVFVNSDYAASETILYRWSKRAHIFPFICMYQRSVHFHFPGFDVVNHCTRNKSIRGKPPALDRHAWKYENEMLIVEWTRASAWFQQWVYVDSRWKRSDESTLWGVPNLAITRHFSLVADYVGVLFSEYLLRARRAEDPIEASSPSSSEVDEEDDEDDDDSAAAESSPPLAKKPRVDEAVASVTADAKSVHGRCVVCLAREATVVYMNCSHLAVCEQCVANKDLAKTCPVCRQHSNGTMQIINASHCDC